MLPKAFFHAGENNMSNRHEIVMLRPQQFFSSIVIAILHLEQAEEGLAGRPRSIELALNSTCLQSIASNDESVGYLRSGAPSRRLSHIG